MSITLKKLGISITSSSSSVSSLSLNSGISSKYSKSKKIRSASKKDIHTLTSFCIKNLEKKNFFKPSEKKPIMLENLRSIFYKMELSEKETRILSSVFANLAKKG